MGPYGKRGADGEIAGGTSGVRAQCAAAKRLYTEYAVCQQNGAGRAAFNAAAIRTMAVHPRSNERTMVYGMIVWATAQFRE